MRVPPIDWSNVRPIYKKLSDEFKSLTGPFGFTLDKETKFYLDHLIIAIDVVDEVLDEIIEKEGRDTLSLQMTEFLSGGNSLLNNKNTTLLLNDRLINLRKVINLASCSEAFIQSALTIFRYTESKRHVISIDQLLQEIQIEGNATADMPLSIMGDQATIKFQEFFKTLCQLMGIVDLIFDARDDYKTKKLTIKPSLALYFRLFSLTISKGFGILRMAPNKWSFLTYCVRFGYCLIKGG